MTFYDVISYAGVLVIGLLLGRYGARSWRDASARLDALLAEHRAEKQRDHGLDIVPGGVRNAPRSRRRRRSWADIHDVFPADDPLPQRVPVVVPEGPTLELARLADDEAMERLVDADLPHFRPQEQNQ